MKEKEKYFEKLNKVKRPLFKARTDNTVSKKIPIN
jgi:hypothetical protein